MPIFLFNLKRIVKGYQNRIVTLQKYNKTMKLLLSYAYDSNSNLVHIDNAQKGHKYTCPNCGAELLLKISKIPEGQKYHRRYRFAHKGNSDNHCSESFLHKLFKERCAEYIREKIAAREDFLFEWECEKCYEYHRGNLLKKAARVVTEYDLCVCKPDIALLDCNEKVVIVVEVVVAHKPEPNTLQYYEDNKIACLLINVEDFTDCENIAEKLSHPNKVNLCPNPICKKCGNVMHNSKIVTVATECWKCGHNMTIAMMLDVGRISSPADFNTEEIEIAKTLGANIQKRYSKTVNDNYFANVCAHCNAFVGDFYMHEYFDLPHTNEIDLDYKCFNCIKEAAILENQAKEEELRKKGDFLIKLQSSEEHKICPKCGGALKIRSSYRGPFWGCENYPSCKHTENIKELES